MEATCLGTKFAQQVSSDSTLDLAEKQHPIHKVHSGNDPKFGSTFTVSVLRTQNGSTGSRLTFQVARSFNWRPQRMAKLARTERLRILDYRDYNVIEREHFLLSSFARNFKLTRTPGTMAIKYVFSCPHCDAPTELLATQAGQEMACESCSAAFSAPKLGDIKSLPVAAGQSAGNQAGRAQTKSGSVIKSWLFAGGLLLAVAAGIGAFAVQNHAQSIYVEFDLDEAIQSENDRVEEALPTEIYQLAVAAAKEDFTLEWREPYYRAANKQSSVLQGVANGLWGASGLGLLLLIASFAIRGQNK